MWHRFGKSNNYNFLYVYPDTLQALLNAEGNDYFIFKGKGEKAKGEVTGRYGLRHPLNIQSFTGTKPLQQFAFFCGKLSLSYWVPPMNVADSFSSRDKLPWQVLEDTLNNDSHVYMGFLKAAHNDENPYEDLKAPLSSLIVEGEYYDYLDRMLKREFIF